MLYIKRNSTVLSATNCLYLKNNKQTLFMHVYFFAEYAPNPQMLEDLGGSITQQFDDPISDIHRKSHEIVFTENRISCGQRIKIRHTIPADSIVVLNGSLLLQDAWLKAGVHTLLIPQMKQEVGKWGSILFKYCGLLQVRRIEVSTSEWTGTTSATCAEKIEKRIALAIK